MVFWSISRFDFPEPRGMVPTHLVPRRTLPMDHEGSLPGRRGKWLLAALVVGGIAGNGFGLPVLAHAEFRFGSLFTLLVLQLYGAVPAVAAALIGSLPLWLPGGHPEAVVWLTAEAAFLGWFLHRRRTGLVQADLLFWVLAGMPLAFGWLLLAQKATPSAAELGAAHAMVNGLADALAARLVFLAWATAFRGERVPAQEAVFDLLAAFVMVPALVLMGLGGRSGFRPMDPRPVLLPVPLVLAAALGAARDPRPGAGSQAGLGPAAGTLAGKQPPGDQRGHGPVPRRHRPPGPAVPPGPAERRAVRAEGGGTDPGASEERTEVPHDDGERL
jgi:hypothetical protein